MLPNAATLSFYFNSDGVEALKTARRFEKVEKMELNSMTFYT